MFPVDVSLPRVNAFVAGGFVPESARGQIRNGYLHVADWYRTLCHLAGGTDCGDITTSKQRGVPPVDGFDVWQYVVGVETESPRTEIMVARCEHPNQHNIPNSTAQPACTGAYIRGDFKVVLGIQYYGFWQGLTRCLIIILIPPPSPHLSSQTPHQPPSHLSS
jgi:hypothetical protein